MDDLLSALFFSFFLGGGGGHGQNISNITKNIAPLACKEALQLKRCVVKPLSFDRAPFQLRSEPVSPL